MDKKLLDALAAKAEQRAKDRKNAKQFEVAGKMLTFVQQEYEKTTEKMAALKADGKEKSATYRQLMGNKLTYQNLLAMYRLYDLL